MGFKRSNKKQRKVLRKIFGPTKERDGIWRIEANDELDKLIRHKNIINYIKEERMVKKSTEEETDVKKTTRETKEQMER
jgi:hypothetical protein